VHSGGGGGGGGGRDGGGGGISEESDDSLKRSADFRQDKGLTGSRTGTQSSPEFSIANFFATQTLPT